MATYRPSELYDAIKARIEALTPDSVAGDGDGFTCRIGFPDQDAGPRIVYIEPFGSATTQRRNLVRSAQHDIELVLVTRYPTHAAARAMDDAAKICDALRAQLPELDCELADLPPPQIQQVGDELFDVVITATVGYTYSGAT